MIISVSGPASTGKTTMIEKIRNLGNLGGFQKVIIVDEIIRKIYEEHFLPIYGPMSELMHDKRFILEWVHSAVIYTKEYIKRCIDKYDSDDTLVILDRCTLDHFVYFILFTSEFQMSFSELHKIIKEYVDREDYIDLIFLTSIPKNDIYEVDSVRPAEWKENRKLEEDLFKMLFKGNYISLPDNIDDRITVMDYNIKKFCYNKRNGIGI